MQTIRQAITELLTESEYSALTISGKLGISEKEVYEHLEHIQKSAKSLKKKLRVTPFACLQCHFVFKDRRRLTRPGRCPKCKGSHIQNAFFRIV